MSVHPRETLDETIDRVAAGVTYASADPALVARIHDRIASSGSRHVEWWRLAMPAVGVAAVVLFAFVMLPGGRTSPEPVHVAVAPPAPEPIAAAAVRPAIEPVAQPASAPRARRQRPTPFVPQIPQIAALSSPAALAVDDITANELTIAPVGFASLDLANLAFTDADRPDNPKE